MSLRRLGLASALLGLVVAVTACWSWFSAPTWGRIQSAIDREDLAQAESLLRRWVARHPDDGRAWLALGSVRATLGHHDQARASLERVPHDDPVAPRAFTLLGDLAWRAGEPTGAEAAFRRAIAREPAAVVPRRKLLTVLFATWRKDEARPLLMELHGLTGDARHLVAATGLALERAQPQQLRDLGGEFETFKKDLDRLLQRAPEDPWLRRARGLVQLDRGRPGEALPDLFHAVDRFDDDPTLRLALGEGLLMENDLDQFDDRLGPAPTTAVERGRWLLARSRAARHRGETDHALSFARQAVEAFPASRAAWYHLGGLELDQEKTDLAGAAFTRAEEVRQRTEELKRWVQERRGGVTDPAECETIAQLCESLSLNDEARAWWRLAVRLDPLRPSAQRALARTDWPASSPSPTPRLRVATIAPGPSRRDAAAPEGHGPMFEDVATRAGLTFTYDSGAHGDLFIADTMGGGVALFDFDGDSWLDVYFVNGCPLPVDPTAPPAPNRLFRNQGDGTFRDVTRTAGAGGRGYGMGCAVGDYDGDGHDDLLVTGLSGLTLYRNRGDGTFEDVTTRAGLVSDRWCTAAGFADLDRDGDLDLMVVTYVEAHQGSVPTCHDASGQPIHCPPGKFPAQRDHLFRNNGDGTFTDVAATAGLEVPHGRGLGLAIADLNGDGRLDLFVANDAVPDFLFLNQGDWTFQEVGGLTGAAFNGDGLSTASMGVVADDLDGDGLIDLFHTNFRNESNTFLRNLGRGRFVDATAGSGLDGPSRAVTGFGAAAADFDNDGDVDLVVANGHVDDQPWSGQPMAQTPHLYEAVTPGRFRPVGPERAGPYFARTVVGRGLATGDLDNDGFVDVVVVHRDAPAAFLRNTGREGHWLQVQLVGGPSGRTAVGARVECRAGDRRMVRWQTAGTSYLSAHDPRLHFGLGPAKVVDEVIVTWPSGKTQRIESVAADQVLTVREVDHAPRAAVPSPYGDWRKRLE